MLELFRNVFFNNGYTITKSSKDNTMINYKNPNKRYSVDCLFTYDCIVNLYINIMEKEVVVVKNRQSKKFILFFYNEENRFLYNEINEDQLTEILDDLVKNDFELKDYSKIEKNESTHFNTYVKILINNNEVNNKAAKYYLDNKYESLSKENIAKLKLLLI
ncbi:hypothetical protein Bp8pS_165 [Bacillus phage vB_BpuM-BpSp]|nr:hypothetical protein Bp8pS_165 [Bacillus phage vB_BpuM-BpSp]